MYIRVYGPKNPIFTYREDAKELIRPYSLEGALAEMFAPFETKVDSLKEALEEYCNYFEVSLKPNGFNEDPYFSNKYFIHKDLKSGAESLVDVHVCRGVKDHIVNGGESICIEQNINFEIQDQDIISMGPLIC